MTCPRCRHENEAGAKFCEECAAPLARACAKCGRPLSPTAKFCPECAHPTGPSPAPAPAQRFDSPEAYTPKHLAERILTSKSALEGERKQVTVLFADLKGSMELLADRDPEEARKLLDPVLERMMEAVHRYEGTVNQVMGDGIMALFGAPLAHEDHAVRACYAALRMQEAVKRYAENVRRGQGVTIRIRVGLNSGEVVVRAIGSDLHMDYTAVGQTTHLAARMEQMATAGSTLMTASALRLAEGYVQVRPLGPVPVKGLTETVETYELTGAATARSRLQAATTRGLTPFVGRAAEIEQLEEALERARGGQGQVVAVVGEPGVGKSRLTWEVTHSLRVKGWLRLETGATSYDQSTAFLPVIELLRAYCQVESHDEAGTIRDKVIGKLDALDPALAPDRAALLWLLHVSVDDPSWDRLDPPQRRQKALDAVKRLLILESQVQPLLLHVEDLHWTDAETQALLGSLVESLPRARLLLLVTYRPEYQHAWSGKSYFRQLRIDPLGDARADEMLAALLGADATLAPLKRALIERTEGNPFFLEESARAAVESGILTGTGGAYRLQQAPGDRPWRSQIPATVQAVLAARIDRLAPEDKHVLQAAAVIGHDVPFSLLQAIVRVPEDALGGSLTRLQAAEFLHEARLFPDREYTFKHALTHEVAYAGLLHDRRRALHAAVTDAMERHYAGRLAGEAERLAHHAVRGEAWEKAVAHLWQAGRNARTRSAYRQAVALLEAALQALGRLPHTRENATRGIDLICHDLRDPLWMLLQHDRLLGHLGEAARLAEAAGDRARLADVLARTALSLISVGAVGRAVDAGERALALATDAGDPQVSLLAGIELAYAHAASGNMARAESLLTQALAALDSRPGAAPDLHAAWLRRRTLSGLVIVLAGTGRYREALRRGEEGLRLAEELGHPAPVAGALALLGWVYCELGEADRAIDVCSRSVALAREREVRDVLRLASAHLGVAYTLASRTDEAVVCVEEAAAVETSTPSGASLILVALGRAYLAAGRPGDASRCAGNALAAARREERRLVEASALHLIGAVAARRDPPVVEEAVRSYRQALALAAELGARPLVAHCHLGLGTLYRRLDKPEPAQEHLTIATTLYREMGMTFWLEQAEAELAPP